MTPYPGRPRMFTVKKQQELLEHISQGTTLEEAARIVGVSLRTIQRTAKYDETFDHDLQLALHSAPVDPHELMQRAARTHWRAAAWLLERSDPDRFAKRSANSCRPEQMMDVISLVIEKALEATPAEHRDDVYRRARNIADRALHVVMPDQHISRRGLADALATRRMPLSDKAYVKSMCDPNYQPYRPPLPEMKIHNLLGTQPVPWPEFAEEPKRERAAEPTAERPAEPPVGPEPASRVMSPEMSAATKLAATATEEAPTHGADHPAPDPRSATLNPEVPNPFPRLAETPGAHDAELDMQAHKKTAARLAV